MPKEITEKTFQICREAKDTEWLQPARLERAIKKNLEEGRSNESIR